MIYICERHGDQEYAKSGDCPKCKAELKEISDRCTVIADRVEPRYRDPKRSYSCCGHVAKLWQSAWDGACVALGGNPKAFLR